MVWTIGGVTLPYAPEKMVMPKGCQKDDVTQDQGYPIFVVSGFSSEVTCEGTISEDGKNAVELVTDYVNPLVALVGTKVSVTTTDGLIDGDWLLDSFVPSRDGPQALFKYTMRLKKGADVITYG